MGHWLKFKLWVILLNLGHLTLTAVETVTTSINKPYKLLLSIN